MLFRSQKVRIFRLSLTLLAAFCMGVMIVIRQQLLDRELFHLLHRSRESFENLKRLQAQIVQSEKQASIGQLVGGAAHELNNPITAMLGYSDLLLSTPLTAEQQPLAAKIGHYVRRTMSLVASLISFARPAQSPKTSVDLNTLARTAIQLTQSNLKAMGVQVRTQLDNSLPKVAGDSNQLLQVCIQLLANCLHLLRERGGKVLTLSTQENAGFCCLQITTDSSKGPESGDGSAPLEPEESLGLSACQGILQEHRGRITSESREDGVLIFGMEIPPVTPTNISQKQTTVPVLWQSQPFA